ncbi:hypothetical protein N9540_00290 [Gammaproteobacteria bacterium]|nr:hypothetical protein [Gammaproteobacteria bacterium]
MNKILLISLVLILSGCSKGLMPMTGMVMPERNTDRLSEESYGEYPENYQKILKDFLQETLVNHEGAKVEFINKPSKISISQMRNDYNGYRLCLSINSQNNKLIYTGFKTHLFIINNSKVNLHLFDSGLLKIPFELCVDRRVSDSMLLNDIPDQPEDIKIDEMDTVDLEKKSDEILINTNNIYILCEINQIERTFYFNESKEVLVESIGVNEMELESVKFSTTHILGSNETEEILINRVSGSLIVTETGEDPISGECKLLDIKKF